MKTQPWKVKLHYNVFCKKNFCNENVFDKLYPSGSLLSHFYGSPKIRKFSTSDLFPKLYPIVSSIGTFNYNLACFLCDLLSPLAPNDYSCKDTNFFCFVKLRMQTFLVNFLFPAMLLVFLLILHFKKSLI